MTEGRNKKQISQRTTKILIRHATGEDSDQPAHPRSLTRVFADHTASSTAPDYPKTDKREPLPLWVSVQDDLVTHVLFFLFIYFFLSSAGSNAFTSSFHPVSRRG